MGLRKRVFIYTAAFVLGVLLMLFIYYNRQKLGKIISPFVIALIIAYLLSPMVKKLERMKIPCSACILLIYLVFFLILTTIIIFIIPEIISNTKELMNTLPDITLRYQGMLDNVMRFIQSSGWPQDIKAAISSEIQNTVAVSQNIVMNTLKRSLSTMVSTISAMFDVILSMIIAYYFIKDAEAFKESLLSLIPRKWRNGIINTGRGINVVLSNFIQGQMLTALIVGTMEGAGLWLIKVKYPFVLGAVGGLANIIPYFGPILGAIPAVAVAIIQSPLKVLWTVVVFTVIQQIDNAFISPKIIEGKLGLHPVTTIIAVLAGGEFFGIAGMLAAVPITAIVKVVLKNVIEAIV